MKDVSDAYELYCLEHGVVRPSGVSLRCQYETYTLKEAQTEADEMNKLHGLTDVLYFIGRKGLVDDIAKRIRTAE